MWVTVILGVGVIVVSLMTDFDHGVIRVIPMTEHLGVDLAAGIVLAVSPWLFGFTGAVWAPNLAFGLLAVGTGMLTERHARRVSLNDPGEL